jgi:hypothetical protein
MVDQFTEIFFPATHMTFDPFPCKRQTALVLHRKVPVTQITAAKIAAKTPLALHRAITARYLRCRRNIGDSRPSVASAAVGNINTQTTYAAVALNMLANSLCHTKPTPPNMPRARAQRNTWRAGGQYPATTKTGGENKSNSR